MSGMQVLAVSESDDHHVQKVLERMNERLVTNQFIQTDKLFNSLQTWLIPSIASEQTSNFWCPDTAVVWNRSRSVVPAFINEPIDSFILQGTEGFVSAILNRYNTAKCVSKRESLAKARSKIDQLIQAKKLGMVIPDTIITTSEKALRDFFQRYKGQIIVKPIQTQVINTGGDSLVFGSRKLSDTELGSACADTACFAQATIEIAAEIRVVMFGRECRAFKMTRSQKVEDLKQLELKDIEHEVFQLGTTEKMQICTLMDYYDLEFAACDFILTPKDELVFLELNPNGQWLWLQYMTGFNLIDPFIDFLTT